MSASWDLGIGSLTEFTRNKGVIVLSNRQTGAAARKAVVSSGERC
jgi:hypothetical protein